ncbi:unnamed protein product [Chilo suppressalis]|uniref:Uncharacterized protein n=1 Tax=Chilo suppressalis TaxID=168631 RepID=A0ABN8L6B0_CHISP|nr:unnamed protein product [Chilo suppressalis]
MKKVIFICLLSFSICMSRPDGAPGSASQAAATQQPPPPNTPSPTTEHNDTSTVPQAPTAVTTSVVAEVPSLLAQVVTTANATKTINDTNRTTEKNETAKPSNIPPVTEKVTPTPSPVPENKENTTTTDHTMKNVTTTVKPTSKPTTTETPKATDAPPLQARGFDGPSFIGGIILTLGLLAIGFMGFKYYKNHTEGIYNPLS